MTSQEQVSLFLDELRKSGECNMFGAGQYVVEAFGLDKKTAKEMTLHWMKNFKR